MIVGCAFPEGEQGMNVARLIALLASADRHGRDHGQPLLRLIDAGDPHGGGDQLDAGEVFVCAGVESMTRVQIGGFNFLPNARLVAEYPQAYMSMGETAENVAKQYQITRDDQEEFAVQSHAKAAAAGRGQVRRRDRADQAQRRGDRAGRLHSPGTTKRCWRA